MNDEYFNIVKIIVIGGIVGLFVGFVLRFIFKRQSLSFVKGVEGLSWGWFLLSGIFMLGLAFFSWFEGSLWGAVIFFMLGILNLYYIFPARTRSSKN